MGTAQITSDLGEGRYRLSFDYGEATRAALVAGLERMIVGLEQDLNKQRLEVLAADQAEATMRVQLAILVNQIIDATDPEDPASDAAVKAAQQAYAAAYKQYAQLVAANRPVRIRYTAIKLDLASAQKRLTYWGTIATTETRDAWCTTYTTGASGNVGTIEIPGEPSLVLIGPNAPAANPASDGALTERAVTLPGAAYFNVAILPGWQAFMPTYRWGTLASIDWDADTCTVELAPATSSAQRLSVNRQDVLYEVPISYMSCNARAFSLGDNVVVSLGGSWSTPTVIGFVSDPLICPPKKKSSVGTGTYPCCAEITDVDWTFANSFDYGKAPFQYEMVSGSLPNGLLFDPSAGTIAGLPTQTGTFPIVVRVFDSLYDGENRRYDDLGTLIFSVTKDWSFVGGDIFVDRVATDLSERIHIEPWSTSTQAGITCRSTDIDGSGTGLVHVQSAAVVTGQFSGGTTCTPTYEVEVERELISSNANYLYIYSTADDTAPGTYQMQVPVPIFRSAFRTELGGVAAPDNTYYTLVIRFVMRCFIRTSPLGTKVAMGSVSGFVRFTMPYGITP